MLSPWKLSSIIKDGLYMYTVHVHSTCLTFTISELMDFCMKLIEN